MPKPTQSRLCASHVPCGLLLHGLRAGVHRRKTGLCERIRAADRFPDQESLFGQLGECGRVLCQIGTVKAQYLAGYNEELSKNAQQLSF